MMEDRVVAKISLEIIDGKAISLFETSGRWDIKSIEFAIRAANEAKKIWDTVQEGEEE